MRYAGIVQKGNRRGTALGFPTVNILLADPGVSGVYAARVRVGEEWYEAAAFVDRKRNILEAHILDFSADLYGWNVAIELLKKIRENKRFSDDDSLIRAIGRDVQTVRAYFQN